MNFRITMQIASRKVDAAGRFEQNLNIQNARNLYKFLLANKAKKTEQGLIVGKYLYQFNPVNESTAHMEVTCQQ